MIDLSITVDSDGRNVIEIKWNDGRNVEQKAYLEIVVTKEKPRDVYLNVNGVQVTKLPATDKETYVAGLHNFRGWVEKEKIA